MDRYSAHNHQKKQQIILPMIAGVFFFVVIIGLIIFFCQKDPTLARRIVDILAAFFLFILIFIGIALLFCNIKAIAAVKTGIRKLPESLDKANDSVEKADPIIQSVLRKTAEPFISILSKVSGILSLSKNYHNK